MGYMDRYGEAKPSGNLWSARTLLGGSWPFSDAFTWDQEKEDREFLKWGSIWAFRLSVDRRWLGRLRNHHGFLCIPPESQEKHTHDWDLTACPGHTLTGAPDSQVVQHTWHESKNSPSHMPPGKQCSAGSCCKNFLDQCRYLQGFSFLVALMGFKNFFFNS